MRRTEQAHTPFSARAALTAALILGLLLVGVIWMRQNDLRAKNDALEAQLAAADFGTLCRVSPEAMGGLLRQKNIFLT